MNTEDLKKLYEVTTGSLWSESDGVMWLMENYEHLDIYRKILVLDKSAHVTLSDKVSWLSQQRCHVCHPDFPISVIALRISPESWQALDSIDKAAFKAAVSHRFLNSHHIKAQEGRICLTFLFICSVRRRVKDLDNMAKLVMDSIKGIVMGDDRDVDHLNIMRLTHEDEEEYVTFRISASNINNHDDVVYRKLRHSWAGAELLKIEDFRKPSNTQKRPACMDDLG